MTIRPGEPWGVPADGTAAVATAGSDAELAALAVGPGPFAVRAGDLHRAVGSPQAASASQIVPVDALAVTCDDGPERLAVAHLVARNGWWRGELLAVCNADFVGAWNVAPRAHPNDGRADVVAVAATMGVRARWQAWRRLPSGTHLPHPAISTRSVRTATFEFRSPMRVWLDGVPAGRATTLTVTVRPDAFTLLI